MILLYSLITIAGSLTLTLQKSINAALGKRVGSIESSFINHVVGTLFAGILLIIGFGKGSFEITNIPWFLFIGGFLGIIMVSFVNYAIPIIGVMSSLMLMIASQLLTSSLIDHLGLLGNSTLQINTLKTLGILFIASGAILVLSKKE